MQLPITVRPQLRFVPGSGSIDVTVSARFTMGHPIDHVVVELPLPRITNSCQLSASVGSFSFDPVSKLLRWDIGKIPPQKVPTLRGSVVFVTGAPIPDATPPLRLFFRMENMPVSGIKVNRLDVHVEKVLVFVFKLPLFPLCFFLPTSLYHFSSSSFVLLVSVSVCLDHSLCLSLSISFS